MIEILVGIFHSAASGIGSGIADLGFRRLSRSSSDSDDSPFEEMGGQSEAVIDQVGENANDVDDIASVLDGFSIEYGEQGHKKNFKFTDENSADTTDGSSS